jgi:hypothetical protein
MRGHGRRRGMHGLREKLATEDPTESIAFVGCPESVVAQRLQPQRLFEAIQRREDRFFERGAAQRTRQIGCGGGLVSAHLLPPAVFGTMLAYRVSKTLESMSRLAHYSDVDHRYEVGYRMMSASLPTGDFGHPVAVAGHDAHGVGAVPVGAGVGDSAQLVQKAGGPSTTSV